jgi:hypothetical protein
MKKFFMTYLKVFFAANVAFLGVAAIVLLRLNLTYPFARLELGALLFALFVSTGIRILRASKGNAVVNAILGFLAILPGVAVMRIVFSIAVFRFAFVVWLFAGVAAIAYAAAVVVIAARGKKEAEQLNRMLSEQPKQEQVE